MRNFYLLLFLLHGLLASAQDDALFDTEWYLNELIVDGKNISIPSNEELAGIPTKFFPAPTADIGNMNFKTSACNEFTAQLSFDGDGTFTVVTWHATMAFCQNSVNDGFDPKYFSIFEAAEQPHKYEIVSSDPDQKTLVITAPNGDTASYGSEKLLAETQASNAFAIFPNPAKEVLFIKRAGNAPVSVKIYDLLGKLRLQIPDAAENISLQGLAPGIYLISIKSTTASSTLKLVKL